MLLYGCKEDLSYIPVSNDPPSIESFSPAEGPVFSQITVRGTNLNLVDTAYIGNQRVQLYRKVSSQELVLVATGTVSGKIRLTSTIDKKSVESLSEGTFTYTYVEPSISESQIPASAEVGMGLLLMGDNMIAVQKVYTVDAANPSATPVEATVVSREMNEVLILVPYTDAAAVKFFVTYYDGQSYLDGETTTASTAMTVHRPTISTLSSTTVDENGAVSITGTYLDRVNKVTIGGLQVEVTTQAAASINVKIPVDVFPDGSNTDQQLTLEYFQSAQQLNYPTLMTVNVPEIYKGSGTINGRARGLGVFTSFYGFKLGRALENSTYSTQIDPVCCAHVVESSSSTWSGLTCSAGNTTNKTIVSEQDYFSVEPYLFLQSTGAGVLGLSSAANGNTVLRNFYFTSSGGNCVLGVPNTNKNASGTPIVMFFNLPLNSADTKIQSVITAVRNNTLNKIGPDNFAIDTENKTIGGISVTAVAGTISSTNWAVGMTIGQTDNNLVASSKDGVVMVIHYDYGGYEAANPTKGIYKIGFVHVLGCSYVPENAGGAEPNGSKVTLESFWQKRPYNPVQY